MNRLTDRPASRRRMLTIVAVLLEFLLAACTIGPVPTDQAESARAIIGPTDWTPTRSMTTISDPPSTPPAQICGNASILNGPAAAPSGAVVINVGDNIETLTAGHPAGTTYWLTPGTHRFSYSVVPKDGNTYVGAPGATIDGGGIVNIAFWEEFYGRRAKNVTLSHLTIQDFTSSTEEQGSIYAGVGWKIANSTLKNHGYVALFAGPDNVIENNCFDGNGQLGIGTFRFDGNTYNVTVDHNEFKNNNTRNLQDCGCGGGMKWWTMKRGKFTNNWVHNNKGPGVWADNNNIEILFEGNYINDNDGEGIFYEISYNFMIRSNTIIRNALAQGAIKNGNFPVGGVYISESGGVNIPGYRYSVSEISHNFFEDNWDGVVLWESGNRYATDGSGHAPRYGDPYHWKTLNVDVHDNAFLMNKNNAGCKGSRNCGRNGLFSDWVPVPGPAGSPNFSHVKYQESVSFNQNNVFRDNWYFGSWSFVAYDDGLLYGWTVWRNPKPVSPSPFNYPAPGSAGFAQDRGSSMYSTY